ncbi:MAG: anti-sigma regulatory factor [Phormidesmis sp.]
MSEKAHLTVDSHLEELAVVQQWFRSLVARFSAEAPWINDQFDKLNLALAEGFTNAVRHAHADLPGTTPIDIELVLQADKIEIFIFDQGQPFDPNSIGEPKPGALREGGYGWFLLRRLADQVTYSPMSNQLASQSLSPNSRWRNCLRIVKGCAS